MKICHSSDWHLGHTLYGSRRYKEQKAFLDWLTRLLQEEKVDLLLVAGDIFDSSTPPLQAQTLYYQFLSGISKTGCRNVIIIGGNHDSPSLLNAPRQLLKALNINVIGDGSHWEQELIAVPSNDADIPQAIVCAVPFLRDQDIRRSQPGEGSLEKELQLQHGIRQHYEKLIKEAQELQNKTLAEYRLQGRKVRIPIITMGHLYAKGGRLREGDGVRGLYVGALAHFDAAFFEQKVDYCALGHLHIPQKAGQSDYVRYSGSPIPMGFNEARQLKQVMLVDFSLDKTSLTPVEVPVFQKLMRISGNFAEIQRQIQTLTRCQEDIWLELIYTGDALIPGLQELFEAELAGSEMKILRLDDRRKMEEFTNYGAAVNLSQLDEEIVFERVLEAAQIPQEQRQELQELYEEIIHSLKTAEAKPE
jgi:DNA repair protein SbcD/Mre11